MSDNKEKAQLTFDVLEVFKKLTEYTAPYGFEDEVIERFPFVVENLAKDEFGNYLVKIGDSRTVFTSHLDTASNTRNKVVTELVVQEKTRFLITNNKSILGADDKAGVLILLYLIANNVPGLYYFFLGEERGCIGSRAAKVLDWTGYDRMISFDRRGYDSVITHQSTGVCCSNVFAQAICDEFSKNGLRGFRPDDTGIYTDSAQFVKLIPECTNISVGYYNEHSVHEYQNITFLEWLCRTVVKVSWETLPTVRDKNSSGFSQKYGNYREDFF